MSDSEIIRSGPDEMGKSVLITTLTSPYGRKVRIGAEMLGLTNKIELRPANTRDSNDELLLFNPLGKMPCLVLQNMAIFDSSVILECFDMLTGGDLLIPNRGVARLSCLTAAALTDGIIDAALLMVYESRFRKSPQVSPDWLAHQRGKVLRGLDALSACPPKPDQAYVDSITLACALGYLDWRRPIEWRESHPMLADWLNTFAATEPSFNATEQSK